MLNPGGNEFIDLNTALNAEVHMEGAYDERDLSIYALGVGAAADPMDHKGLAQVYELSSDGFKGLHTYLGTNWMTPMVERVLTEGKVFPGLNYGNDRVLHGEQYTEIKQVMQPHAKLDFTYRIKSAQDKDPHAVVIMEIVTKDENGVELAVNETSFFVRGAGGWGGDRGPKAESVALPEREPDALIEQKIPENQALLYRLSGDANPLHADPVFAKNFGFDKPILHGMCTHGFCGRHIVEAFADNDPRYLKSIKVRFADPVYPGETLQTRMWKEDGKILFEARVKERDAVVLSDAFAELFEELPEPV